MADILTLVIVLLIGACIGMGGLMIFIYALWSLQDDEATRTHPNSHKQNEGNPW